MRDLASRSPEFAHLIPAKVLVVAGEARRASRGSVKPLASIAQPQQTVDQQGNPSEIVVKGRHDPTALPRLVPIAEAMLALVLADHLLRQRMARV